MKRIAVLVGHSYSAVERIIAKYEKGHPLSTPGKHKKRPRCVTGIDDFSKEAIARFIYDRLNRGERVTAKLVLDHVMENHGSATHSWSKPAIVGGKVQGVMRRPAEGGRLVIVHAGTYNGFIPGADLIFASNLKTGQDYHGAMNSETFQKWVERHLIVGLRDVGPSIIVMDNVSYHNKAAEEQPTTKWRKDHLMGLAIMVLQETSEAYFVGLFAECTNLLTSVTEDCTTTYSWIGVSEPIIKSRKIRFRVWKIYQEFVIDTDGYIKKNTNVGAKIHSAIVSFICSIMKTVVLIFLLVTCTLVASAPAEEEHVRVARVSCELGTIQILGFKAGDGFCAAHCLTMGKNFNGGYCKKGVCHCHK
ncbi:uncharacterized protein [Periplaneta americana]|uniref:uncharacterized protein n=1 Tax=Periplaneta americana TaxID=6978 RepID=UPI0037E70547